MSQSIEMQMEEILKTFDTDLNEAVEKTTRKVAQDAAKKLRSNSPGAGDYAKGWTYKKDSTGFGAGYVVYNKSKPGLTHLLENGHAVKPSPKHPGKKSRVAPRVHIKPVEEAAKTEYEQLLRAEISKG